MEVHFILASHLDLLNGQYGSIPAGNGTLAQAFAANFAVAGITIVPNASNVMVALQRPRPAVADNIF